MQHICRHHYMIKLITITRKYIKLAYTTDKQLNLWNTIIARVVKMTNYLCLNIHQATFDYSTLEAYISKSKNDRNAYISKSKNGRNKWISDSVS